MNVLGPETAQQTAALSEYLLSDCDLPSLTSSFGCEA